MPMHEAGFFCIETEEQEVPRAMGLSYEDDCGRIWKLLAKDKLPVLKAMKVHTRWKSAFC